MDPRNPQDEYNSSSAQNSTPSQPSHGAPTEPGHPQSQYGGQYTPPPQPQYPQQGHQPQYQQQPYPQYQQQYQQYPPPPPKKGGSGLVWGLLGLLVATLVGGGVLLYFLLQPKNGTVTGNTGTNTGTGTVNTPVAGQTVEARPTTGGGSTTGNSGDNASLLKAAAANMRDLDSYLFDANITASGQDVLMKTELENLKGSNKSARMKIEAQGQKVQVVVIGDQVWASVDDGATFTDASANGAQMTSSIDQFANMWSDFNDAEVDKAKDQLKDGSPATETIDGVTTKHMIGDIQSLSSLGGATSGGATEGTIELWVGTDSKAYVHRMRIDATSGGQPVKGTINWSNFNDNFNIQAP